MTTAATFPSCPGRFVTRAVPASVSIIVPLTIIFLKYLLAGDFTTLLILDFWVFLVLGSVTNAVSQESITVFISPPTILRTFFLSFPKIVSLGFPDISESFFFLSGIYFPPLTFLTMIVRTEIRLKTYRLAETFEAPLARMRFIHRSRRTTFRRKGLKT